MARSQTARAHPLSSHALLLSVAVAARASRGIGSDLEHYFTNDNTDSVDTEHGCEASAAARARAHPARGTRVIDCGLDPWPRPPGVSKP